MLETGNKISLNRKITDPLFQEHLPESYNLFIFAGKDEISVAVADRASKKFVALESWNITDDDFTNDLQLKYIQENSTLLSISGYPRVICCSGFRSSTLVPNPLFEPGAAADLFQFGHQNLINSQFFIDEIHQLEAANIFTLPDMVFKTITAWFPHTEFHHSSTPVIEYLLNVNKNSKEELITVIIHADFIEIVVNRGRQLLLYNHFKYDTPEELVYYLLFVCEQLHLNPDHVQLLFTGEINEGDVAYQLSLKYIRNCSIGLRPEIYDYAPAFLELPGQHHFNLFSEVICAS